MFFFLKNKGCNKRDTSQAGTSIFRKEYPHRIIMQAQNNANQITNFGEIRTNAKRSE